MQKIKAIVIKSNDRKEKDKNILLFSIEQGKIWATLKGVKGSTAKMKIAQNPFTFADFVLEDGKAGKIVTSVDVIESFYEISQDVEKYFAGTAILEIINSIDFSSQNEISQVFVRAVKAFKTLCFSVANPIYVLDKFMLELFACTGSPILFNTCSTCKTKAFEKLFFDYQSGELVCQKCKTYSSEELSPVTLSALKILSSTEFDNLKTIKLALESEIGLLRVLERNFQARFEKKLKLIGILS